MRLFPIALLFAGSLSFAQSEAPIATTAPIVVTPSRAAQPLTDALQHTTVITREELQQAQAPDLLTTLRLEAGLENTQVGGIGQQSSTFLRGTDSDHTLVLVNGIRINSATTTGAALEHIAPAAIDRVEIVRGNASSLYGGDAIGGVIQLLTPMGENDPALTLQGGYGERQTGKLGVDYAGRIGRTRFQAGVAGVSTNGFSAIRSAFIPTPFVSRLGDGDRDPYRNTTFNGGVEHEIAPGHELGVRALAARAAVEFDGTEQNASEPELSVYSLHSTNRIFDNWTSRVTLGQATDDLAVFLDDESRGRFKTVNRQITWQNEFALSKTNRLIGGFEWLRQISDVSTVSSFGTSAFDARRRVMSAFAGYLGEFGRNSVQASARHDDYSDVGRKTTGRVGYGFALTPAWRLHASFSTAFKAPTFNDLYFPDFGNAELAPENARTAEIGVQYARANQLLRAVAFKTQIRDLIGTDENFDLRNIDRTEIEGLELSYDAQFSATAIKASFTLQDATDDKTGERLVRRAQRFGSLAVTHQIGRVRVGGELHASGPREDFAIDFSGRVRLKSYATLNALVEFALAARTRFGVRVDNVLDEDYELVHGYNTTPRTAFAYFSHTFE